MENHKNLHLHLSLHFIFHLFLSFFVLSPSAHQKYSPFDVYVFLPYLRRTTPIQRQICDDAVYFVNLYYPLRRKILYQDLLFDAIASSTMALHQRPFAIALMADLLSERSLNQLAIAKYDFFLPLAFELLAENCFPDHFFNVI